MLLQRFKELKNDINFKTLVLLFMPIFPLFLIKRIAKLPLYPATKLVHFGKILKVLEHEEHSIFLALERVYELEGTFPRIEIKTLPKPTKSSDKLFNLFEHHGSDKARKHGYHLVYGDILENLKGTEITILEVGIGSTNTGIISNMGRRGHPGASLRGFRDYSENTTVTGVDIDYDVLFTDTRIETFFLDQTSAQSWLKLNENLDGGKFDLIIDDGLHSPSANLNSIIFGLGLLKPGGAIIIEDIPDRALPVWTLVHKILPPTNKSHLVKCNNSYMFVVSK
jgi:SAM-dependent methyltransferase